LTKERGEAASGIVLPSTLLASNLSAFRLRKFESAHIFLSYSEKLVAANFLEFPSAKVRGQAASGINLPSTLLASNLSAVRPKKFEPAHIFFSNSV
jgi:hypothetical protein